MAHRRNLHARFTEIEHGATLVAGLAVFVTIVAWVAFSDGDARYVIYSLPLTVGCAWMLGSCGDPQLSKRGLKALLLYLSLTAASLAVNGMNAFTARDVWIITSYLVLFCFVFRTPGWVADLALATLAVGLMVEAWKGGFGSTVSLLDSKGILESALAMPLGVLLLFYYDRKDWPRLALTGILFFAAFKRIALLAVILIIAWDLFSRLVRGREGISRASVVIAAAFLTAVALNFQYVFLELQGIVANEELSANRLTLGRHDIANVLWQKWATGGPVNAILGFGPGAADTALSTRISGVLVHNDWLKILIDYGVAGLLAFHAMLLMVFKDKRFPVLVYLYTVIVMMTDNVLIYLFHYVFVAVLLQIDDEPAPALTGKARGAAWA